MTGLPDSKSKPTLTLTEAADLIGVGRTVAYQAVQDGTWPTTVLRLGQRIRIPTAQALALLAATPDSTDNSDAATAASEELTASLDAAEVALRRLIAAMAGVRSLI